jgi:hypothetical protein
MECRVVTPGQEFWWNWWPSVLLSIATFLAVLVALFGPWISAHLFRPKLSLSLSIDMLSSFGPPENRQPARYYYLRASSPRYWPKPTETQVFILRIDERKPNGVFQPAWTVPLPLRWMNQEIWPLARTIARDTEADFFCIAKNGPLSFMTLVVPNRFKSYTGTTNLVVTVQAHARECSSEALSIAIDWDGGWDDGDTEMTNRLSIRELG